MSSESWELHTLRFHPTIWLWAEECTKQSGYKRGVAGCLTGLVVFDAALRRKHWLTAEILNNSDRFQRAIEEIPVFRQAGKNWIESQVREIFQRQVGQAYLPLKSMSESYSLESQTFRFHPKVWLWATVRAEEAGYAGGVSAYLAGLIIYDYALAKRHWLTADIVDDPQRLEMIIKEIANHNPLEGGGAWIEHRLRELFHPAKEQQTEDKP